MSNSNESEHFTTGPFTWFVNRAFQFSFSFKFQLARLVGKVIMCGVLSVCMSLVCLLCCVLSAQSTVSMCLLRVFSVCLVFAVCVLCVCERDSFARFIADFPPLKKMQFISKGLFLLPLF